MRRVEMMQEKMEAEDLGRRNYRLEPWTLRRVQSSAWRVLGPSKNRTLFLNNTGHLDSPTRILKFFGSWHKVVYGADKSLGP